MTPTCPTCGTELLEHPANRCLDAWVAVAVMKWIPWVEQRGKYQYVVWQKPNKSAPWYGSQNPEAQRERYSPLIKFDPHKHIEAGLHKFSTDIAAAWEVVNEVTSKGFYFDLSYDLCAWTATFRNANGGLPISVNTTKSNPSEEICRAALLAVMEER